MAANGHGKGRNWPLMATGLVAAGRRRGRAPARRRPAGARDLSFTMRKIAENNFIMQFFASAVNGALPWRPAIGVEGDPGAEIRRHVTAPAMDRVMGGLPRTSLGESPGRPAARSLKAGGLAECARPATARSFAHRGRVE